MRFRVVRGRVVIVPVGQTSAVTTARVMIGKR